VEALKAGRFIIFPLGLIINVSPLPADAVIVVPAPMLYKSILAVGVMYVYKFQVRAQFVPDVIKVPVPSIVKGKALPEIDTTAELPKAKDLITIDLLKIIAPAVVPLCVMTQLPAVTVPTVLPTVKAPLAPFMVMPLPKFLAPPFPESM
jgi:hypothetical protein